MSKSQTGNETFQMFFEPQADGQKTLNIDDTILPDDFEMEMEASSLSQ